MWNPLEVAETLPRSGERESATLDFKYKLTKERFEIAKDAAAFANAGGGTVLVGCVGKSVLERFEPVSPGESGVAAREIELAVRDLCRPVPLFGVAQVPLNGGFIIATNIWPMPGILIGVRPPVKRGREHRYAEHAFVYPLRIGADTTFISPEQIPMFIDAHTRRIALLLCDFIGQRAVVIADRPRSSSRPFIEAVLVRSVDLFKNAIELVVPAANGKPEMSVTFPLDYVSSACILAENRIIYVKGSLARLNWVGETPAELKALKGFLDPNP